MCSGAPRERWPASAELSGPCVLELAHEHRLDARAGSRLGAEIGPASEWVPELTRAWRTALGEQALFDDLLAELGREAAARQLALVV
ncbi:MAG: hypothetical protein JSV80_07455, partial [Acidobacteriota bacterium]